VGQRLESNADNAQKLEDVRIYESVRVAVARNFRTEYEMMIQGVEL
jgi:hypothetical protein